jgi:hypothetical protein
VPGCWPGITDYLQKDCQTLYAHPDWRATNLGSVVAAWYQRQVSVPSGWAGRRVTLTADTVNSLATVFVDGERAGDLRFPGGELDLTPFCRAGASHLLSLRVEALPLGAVMLSYTDTASARQVKGTVARRGLCGDLWLVSTPESARVADTRVETSFRRGMVTLSTALSGLKAGAIYTLRARIRDHGRWVHQVTSRPFRAGDLQGGRLTFSSRWRPGKLWDLNAPGNQLTAQVELLGPGGRLLDADWPLRFGFRELWTQGRDFYLNGSRIFLSAAQYQNAQVGAAWASYQGARESLARLKSFGINFVYMGNYGCEPGSHLSFSEILRAADDLGMLVALSQPHFSHYDWSAPDADRSNGYASHAAWYVHVAGSHPSVVAYAMSHNATGYAEDMNPDQIDGRQDSRDTWARNNVRLALRAEAIVRRLDPSRVVYHHSSGNLGELYTLNFYANFTPIQEMSDWFEHWATTGVKPLFLCEYAVPFSWDWTMYRGWYKGSREWGSAAVPWEFCLAEWNAQFLGDKAFSLSEREKANLRWEAARFRAGAVWHRWDYPTPVGSGSFQERNPVISRYITDNWRAFRSWGVSAISPWDHSMYWLPRSGIDRRRQALPVDWDRLQRPGFSPDYLEERPEDRVLAFERADWVPTAAGQAVLRNNRPLLAYLGGKPARFTSKDHNFLAGEAVEKQLIVINNSRATVTCRCWWRLGLPRAVMGGRAVVLPTGQRARIPLRFPLPAHLGAGRYTLLARVQFGGAEGAKAPGTRGSVSGAELQEDTFTVNVMAPPPPAPVGPSIAIFDPRGETASRLRALGVRCRQVGADADPAPFDLLVIGKGALTPGAPAPDLLRVRRGLKVIVLEQTAEVLEQRLGFRVAEYGLRQVFPRLAHHPALAGLDTESLRDWRGEARLLPPRLKYVVGARSAPEVKWCGMDVTRVWRCGCRGNVASVLIEKPARGDFLPILDGGFGLQYSPLLEFREGRGMVLFCQLDVTGRTEADPAADRLLRNLLRYAADWRPRPSRHALYAGGAAERTHLESAGFELEPLESRRLTPDAVLVLGPGGGGELASQAPAVRQWLRGGGHLLALGLSESEAKGILPAPVSMRRAEHIAATFGLPEAGSWLAGLGPSDLQNHDPRGLPLVSGGAEIVGGGVLARTRDGSAVLSQLAPWDFSPGPQRNLKRTFRRVAFLTTRLLCNLGVPCDTPLLGRFGLPVAPPSADSRWLSGLYLDTPEEWDDPYRFFCW